MLFSSREDLTEDAYTGPADNRPNLYEYHVESGELTDLTVDTTDPNGAAVLGVVQISEDGSYVYFVATGHLAEGAIGGQPNLYVIHNGGTPKFIATLANDKKAEEIEKSGNDELFRKELEENIGANEGGDIRDWSHGQEENKATISADGTKLAFQSYAELDGLSQQKSLKMRLAKVARMKASVKRCTCTMRPRVAWRARRAIRREHGRWAPRVSIP